MNREGFDIIVKMKPAENQVHLQGIKSYWSVEELNWKILQETLVHPEMQRLFIGGEEMNPKHQLCRYIQIEPLVSC